MSEPDGIVRCLRCDGPTKYVRTRAFRHAGLGSLLGDLLHLDDDSEELDLHVCPKCGHVEFFVSGIGEECRGDPAEDDDEQSPDSGPAWHCPQCGTNVPGNFDICWKCQRARPPEEDTAG
jgi:hypothetical protein